MNWQVVSIYGEMHVRPIDDLKPHAGAGCWCWPTLHDHFWVHHSLDGRESNEQPSQSPQAQTAR